MDGLEKDEVLCVSTDDVLGLVLVYIAYHGHVVSPR